VSAAAARLRATVLVRLAGVAGTVGRTAPGVLGPLLICAGLYLAWVPLGFVAAGAFLLLVDRQIP
jgi:hypothetical protein